MRDPATMRAREAKRATGVYYTPSDVAEYIVAEALRLHGGRPDQLAYFDPACGSGVFLRAAFDLVTRRGDLPAVEATRFVTERLFGSDIDPLAIQGACFVLLERLFTHTERFDPAPFSVWSCIRRNFVVTDSLRLFVPGATTARLPAVGLFDATPSMPRESEAAGAARIGQGEAEEGMELGNLLPAIAEGADIIVGNPPYAPLGQRRDGQGLKDRFASYTEAPSAD
ncbi:MAG: N-6 DNA methylase, partial [Phycisphaerales bacterium]|nr:N-6 DNA methylase [Phycisphaerales bacterium]